MRLAQMHHMEDILRNTSSARYVKLIELGSGKGCMFGVFFSLKHYEGNQKVSQEHVCFQKIDTFPPALRNGNELHMLSKGFRSAFASTNDRNMIPNIHVPIEMVHVYLAAQNSQECLCKIR